jgi:hypothetical protein
LTLTFDDETVVERVKKWSGGMYGKVTNGVKLMNDRDEDLIMIVTERFEGRLTEETGKLRFEMAMEFGKVRTEMATEFGKVRVEMAEGFGLMRGEIGQLRADMALVRADGIERNNELLRWLLVFAVLQTTALGTILALFK